MSHHHNSSPLSLEEPLDSLLLNRSNRLDRFDADYIDDFHHIMRENYDVETCQEGVDHRFDSLIQILKNQFDAEITDATPLENVSKILRNIVSDTSRYRPKILEEKDHSTFHYNTRIDNWHDIKDNTDVSSILTLQKKYSIGGSSGIVDNNQGTNPQVHFNARFANEKHSLFAGFDTESVLLSIGNRWIDEIAYIRNQFNLPNAIGLDLFSADESYVKIGDIHAAPFDDDTFDVIYQKNTFDKLYDLRLGLTECIRILKPGGILISDDCYDYTMGVDPLARSNITSNQWYFKFLREHITDIIYDVEISANDNWINKEGLFAVRIKK